jgi:hypothetical protein
MRPKHEHDKGHKGLQVQAHIIRASQQVRVLSVDIVRQCQSALCPQLVQYLRLSIWF